MFSGISINSTKYKGKRINENSLESKRNKHQFGRPEWQQEWKSCQHSDFAQKELTNNRMILEKSYLKPNYSHFDYVHCPNADPFLTTYKRDIKPINLKERREEKRNFKEFIKASRIVLGDYDKFTNSSYRDVYEQPVDQKSRFNYDNIKFKYDEYKVNPITSELIHKPSQNNWAFDYYNKDKNKFFVSNDKAVGLNTDFRRVYDHITNRYFN